MGVKQGLDVSYNTQSIYTKSQSLPLHCWPSNNMTSQYVGQMTIRTASMLAKRQYERQYVGQETIRTASMLAQVTI